MIVYVSTRSPSASWDAHLNPMAFDRASLADEIGRVISSGARRIVLGEFARAQLGMDLMPGVVTERVGIDWLYDPGLDGPTSVGHLPAGPWTFDESVTRVFDDMLRRSVPQLEVMRAAVVEAASRFVDNAKARVLDVGCSRGQQLAAALVANPGWTASAFDRSVPMVAAARAELARFGDRASVELRDAITDGIPGDDVDVVLLVLTMQFIAPSQRVELLRRLRRRTTSGGCIVVVEKVDAGGEFVDAYHAMKRRNGYTDAEIRAKAESLVGVLVPWTAAANEQALVDAGWGRPECFWRWFNFAAWVARPASRG